MRVIGIGEKKTPEPFITACDKFIYLEILATEDVNTLDVRAKKTKKDSLQKIDKRVLNLIRSSINDVADEEGWAFLGEVGTLILKKQPNFDARNYGFRKLLQLMKSIEDIEVDERQSEQGGTRHVYVRVK
jgi:hypothetical protein